MYLIYVDESGTKDPKTQGTRRDGTAFEKDWLYALVGISLLEMNWFKFEYAVNQCKLKLMERIWREQQVKLELADTEIKSRWVRLPAERSKHPFLSRLKEEEINQLVDLYFAQLRYHAMHLFAVVVDKRHLLDYMDEEKMHRKAYELLVERVEWFMKASHPKHRALMVVDNTSRQMNRSLAMKHSYFQREGTSSGSRIGHIVELPLFVESYLSNGVQLADLCAYSVYRAFKDENIDYPFFARISERIYSNPRRSAAQVEGLKIFPENSPLIGLANEIGHRRAG
jgi:hypothetical protein